MQAHVLMSSAAGRHSEKPATAGHINIDVRLCKECKSTIFKRRDFTEDLLKQPPDVRAYNNLIQFERGIRLLLPKFQKLLAALQLVLSCAVQVTRS